MMGREEFGDALAEGLEFERKDELNGKKKWRDM